MKTVEKLILEKEDLRRSISNIKNYTDRLQSDDRETISRYEKRIDEINAVLFSGVTPLINPLEKIPYEQTLEYSLIKIREQFSKVNNT